MHTQALTPGARVQLHGVVSPLSGHQVEQGGAGRVVAVHPCDRWPGDIDVVVVLDDGRRLNVPSARVALV